MTSAPDHTLHPNELPVDTALVQALLERDCPELAHLPLSPLRSPGSTNVMFRLGDHLAVRLPRQAGGGADIAKEFRLTSMMSETLAVAVPDIIAVGRPGFGYPEQWSVTAWVPGDHPQAVHPDQSDGADLRPLAADLADVVTALRELDRPHPVPADLRWYRGGPLGAIDPQVRAALSQCRSLPSLDLNLGRAEMLWEMSLQLPGADRAGPDRWFHGDLVAENLVVADGRLTGVLDFGATSVGDPTVDLHGAWEILDTPAREVFADRSGVGEVEWLRGRAWALAVAVMALADYWYTMPQRRDDRRAMAQNVLAD